MIAAQFLGKAISMTDDFGGRTSEAARAPRRWWLAKECQRAADYGKDEVTAVTQALRHTRTTCRPPPYQVEAK
jgi:hypothetical protein